MERFAARFEAPIDFFLFIEACRAREIELRDFGVPAEGGGDTVSFTCDGTDLDELIEIARTVPDGHVIVETLLPEAEFTGERDHDR